jgi:hypothetical protein
MRSLIRRLVHFVRPSMRNGSLTEGHELVAGDVVTVTCDDGLFGVMKVLAVDGHGVHARLYVQRFDRRPITAGLGELSTAPFGPDYDNPLSIGHMPLTYEAFAGWQPTPPLSGAGTGRGARGVPDVARGRWRLFQLVCANQPRGQPASQARSCRRAWPLDAHGPVRDCGEAEGRGGRGLSVQAGSRIACYKSVRCDA